MQNKYIHTLLPNMFGKDISGLISENFIDEEKIVYNRMMLLLEMAMKKYHTGHFWNCNVNVHDGTKTKYLFELNFSAMMDMMVTMDLISVLIKDIYTSMEDGMLYIYGMKLNGFEYRQKQGMWQLYLCCRTMEEKNTYIEKWTNLNVQEWYAKILHRIPILKVVSDTKECKKCEPCPHCVTIILFTQNYLDIGETEKVFQKKWWIRMTKDTSIPYVHRCAHACSNLRVSHFSKKTKVEEE